MAILTILPVELIIEISSYLAVDALLAMKLAHPILNQVVLLDNRRKESLTRCAHLFTRDRFTQLPAAPAHRRCVLCKAMYPPSMFRSPDNGATEPLADLLGIPYGVCSWHVGSIMRVVQSEPGERNGWVSRMETMCMHCGSIQNWYRCGCMCNSCAFRETRTFTRFLNNENECLSFSFRASNDQATQTARLMVVETCSTSKVSNAAL
jgi:hypothetical protein